MPGWKLAGRAVHGLRRGHELIGQEIPVRGDVGREVQARRKGQRLELRGESERAAVERVEQRLDADAIAREQEAARLQVPQREGEHTGQALEQALAVLFVEV